MTQTRRKLASTIELTAASAENWVIRLTSAPIVEGMITDEEGHPLPKVSLRHNLSFQKFEWESDENGHYRIDTLPPIPEGFEWDVRIAGGGRLRLESKDFLPGQPTIRDIVIKSRRSGRN